MELSPLIITFKTSALATVVTFFVGIALAYFVVNLKHGKTFIDAVIMLPMVLPPTVVGFFLLLVLGKRSFIGKFLLQFDISFVFVMFFLKTPVKYVEASDYGITKTHPQPPPEGRGV